MIYLTRKKWIKTPWPLILVHCAPPPITKILCISWHIVSPKQVKVSFDWFYRENTIKCGKIRTNVRNFCSKFLSKICLDPPKKQNKKKLTDRYVDLHPTIFLLLKWCRPPLIFLMKMMYTHYKKNPLPPLHVYGSFH